MMQRVLTDTDGLVCGVEFLQNVSSYEIARLGISLATQNSTDSAGRKKPVCGDAPNLQLLIQMSSA